VIPVEPIVERPLPGYEILSATVPSDMEAAERALYRWRRRSLFWRITDPLHLKWRFSHEFRMGKSLGIIVTSAGRLAHISPIAFGRSFSWGEIIESA